MGGRTISRGVLGQACWGSGPPGIGSVHSYCFVRAGFISENLRWVPILSRWRGMSSLGWFPRTRLLGIYPLSLLSGRHAI